MSKLKQIELHEIYQMNSKSLFTSVPLNDTINSLLRRIYIDKEINENFTKKE